MTAAQFTEFLKGTAPTPGTVPASAVLGAVRSDDGEAVAMVADAIKDCSRRGEVVLDIVGGSGSTLIAAMTGGRRARHFEFNPPYCDTIVRRWRGFTGSLSEWATAFGHAKMTIALLDCLAHTATS